MMPHRNQEKDSTAAASIWFEISSVVDPGQTNFDFYRQISEKVQFCQAILQKNIEFCRQISENFDFFRQLKKFDFPSKKLSIYSYLLAIIILVLFKSNHFRTYFLYMIRYNNFSRPVHASNAPPAPLPATPLPKIWGSRPSAPRIDAPR